MKKIIALCVLLTFLFLIGCATEVTTQDGKSTTKSKNFESGLERIPEGQILVFIRTTLHTFAETSENTVNLIDSFSAQEISKDEFCSQIKQKENDVTNTNNQLNSKSLDVGRLKDDVILKKKFQDVKSWVKMIGTSLTGNLKTVSDFCGGGSITKLTNVKKTLNHLNVNYGVYFEKGIRSRPRPSDRYEEIAILFDELKETLLTEPTSSSSQEKTVYGVGDTIEKNGVKVTLNSVKKNYIHPEWSYVKNDREWTDDEWNNDIIDYQSAWRSERDPNLKQQIATELNQKYGSRVKQNLLYQNFDYSFQNLPSDLQSRLNAQSTSAIVRLHLAGTEERTTEKFSLNYGYIRGLFRTTQEYTNNVVKLVISFDNCAFTMEEIASVEKIPSSCPQTFIFTVDMSKINNWNNY